MKHLKDFIFCDGILSSQTVFYLVAVGTSRKDRYAHAFVQKVARSPNFFFCDHNRQSMAFVEKCAESIFHRQGDPLATRYLRRMIVPVTWLATFLRKNPPTLLNSLKISTPENHVETHPSQSVHVKNLSNHEHTNQQKRVSKCSS